MAAQDKLIYFPVRARGEAIRVLYALAGKPLDDVRITMEEWPSKKAEQPLGQLPVFNCAEGTLVQSNTIARYVAMKFGLAGSDMWEHALNDLIIETCLDCFKSVPEKIYSWKIFKRAPEPEDPAKVMEEAKAAAIKGLNYLQKIAELRAKKFIVCDEITVGDVFLYNTLEFSKLAFPDSMELTPWVKEFVSKYEADERIKKYLEERPESAMGL